MSVRTAKRRRWADIVVAFAGAYALAFAAWFPPELPAESTSVLSEVGLWVTYALSGLLGLSSLFVAMKWPRVARIMVVAAGVIMLLSFFTLAEVTLLAVLSIGGTGLAFLLTSPFVGDMPSPAEERREERHEGRQTS